MVDRNYVYVYLRDDMPVNEMITPCADGYTVYINAKLDRDRQIEAYQHALSHIENGDFDIDNAADIQQIEARAHRILPEVEWKQELDRLRKERKKLKAALRKKDKQIKFLQEQGFDFMAAAEERWLSQ